MPTRLQTFERDLSALGNITLHPSLAMNPKDDAVAAGERSLLSRGRTDAGSEATRIPEGGSGGGGQGSRDNLSQQTTVKRVTLLDCVPVEREYKLLESCRTSQRRFGQEGKAVAQKYAAIKRVRTSPYILRPPPSNKNIKYKLKYNDFFFFFFFFCYHPILSCKVANPARGQLNRENEYSPVVVRA